MSNQSLTRNNYQEIIKYGSLFYPADKHYYPGSVVQCDRCDRTNLRTCVGFRENDLCLSCAAQVESTMTQVNPKAIRIGPPPPLTRPPPMNIGRPHNIREALPFGRSGYTHCSINNQTMQNSMEMDNEEAEF